MALSAFLLIPLKHKRKDVGASYSSFAKNLEEFQKIGSVPVNLNVDELNNGQGIAETLQQRKAQWHKTCRNAFSNIKLERAKKGNMKMTWYSKKAAFL